MTAAGAHPLELTVPILTYHHVAAVPSDGANSATYVLPERFARQVGLLHRLGYQSVGVAEVARALLGGTRLPSRSVVFTFDDGWLDVYTEAFPVLERAGFRATLFLVGNAVGQRGIAFAEDRDSNPQRLLSTDQIRELAHKGWEIGAHSNSHVHLTRLSEDDVRREIETGRRVVEVMIGHRPEVFAYPYGDFHVGVERVVRDLGFLAACATTPGRRHSLDDRFHLKRIPVAHEMSLFRFVYSLYVRPFDRGRIRERARLKEDFA